MAILTRDLELYCEIPHDSSKPNYPPLSLELKRHKVVAVTV